MAPKGFYISRKDANAFSTADIKLVRTWSVSDHRERYCMSGNVPQGVIMHLKMRMRDVHGMLWCEHHEDWEPAGVACTPEQREGWDTQQAQRALDAYLAEQGYAESSPTAQLSQENFKERGMLPEPVKRRLEKAQQTPQEGQEEGQQQVAQAQEEGQEEGEKSTYEQNDSKQCGARHKDGYECTRTKGHVGNHIAHAGVNNDAVETWEQAPRPLPPQKWSKQYLNRCPKCHIETLNKRVMATKRPDDPTLWLDYTEVDCGCDALAGIFRTQQVQEQLRHA